jgi:hypothetical protein
LDLVVSMTTAGWGTKFGDALPGLDSNWIGWSGMGGSVFMWNPVLKLSFAYSMTGNKRLQFVTSGLYWRRNVNPVAADDHSLSNTISI